LPRVIAARTRSTRISPPPPGSDPSPARASLSSTSRSGRFDTESGVVCEALRRMLEGDGDADAQTSADDEDDGSSRRRKPPRASS
jgi:Arc/MetJ-type ribon-helix-helix transcriptional regulator